MLIDFIGVVFDGLCYGAVLFLISSGLAITLGLMGFINLAHCAFAMFGGYLLVSFARFASLGFTASVLLSVLCVAIASVVVERVVYRPFYRASHLDQSLLTVGVMLMAGAVAQYVWGASQQAVALPLELQGRIALGPLTLSRYRLLVLAISVLLLLALKWGLERSTFGATLRACVDNQRVAAALGIPVQRIFMLSFAAGSALAALGGALGAEVFGLDPGFGAKNLVLCLLVVVVGGRVSIAGTFAAALLLGVCDIASKYYLPELGAFAVYAVMVAVLIVRPQGLGRVAA